MSLDKREHRRLANELADLKRRVSGHARGSQLPFSSVPVTGMDGSVTDMPVTTGISIGAQAAEQIPGIRADVWNLDAQIKAAKVDLTGLDALMEALDEDLADLNEVRLPSIEQAVERAQAAADGNIRTHTGPDFPTLNDTSDVGDIYYDDDGKAWRWQGSYAPQPWRLIQDAAFTAAIGQIEEAKAALGVLEADLADLNTALEAAQGTIAGHDTSLDTLDEDLAAAKAEVEAATNDVAALTGTTIPAMNAAIEEAAAQASAVLRIDSSKGSVFKNNSISTVLTVTIYYTGQVITNITALHNALGPGAYLEWFWRRENDAVFGVVSSADSRLSQAGFALTVSPADVDEKTVFQCVLHA